MTDERITDEMVESAAEAIFNTPVPAEHPVDWDCMPPEITAMVRAKARAALLAVGLPALLERVEAGEHQSKFWARKVTENSDLGLKVVAQRDALATKVADAWDEGWLASKRHEHSEGQPKMSYWPNPYRTALDASETP